MKCREIIKRTMSIFLTVAMLLQSQSVVTLADALQQNVAETVEVETAEQGMEQDTSVSGNDGSVDIDSENGTLGIQNEIEIEETDSFGTILADQISKSQYQKDKYEGYTISTVRLTGNKATVIYDTLVDAYVLVGIYSEDTKTYIGSGYKMVSAVENETVVDVAVDTMPDYYYVKVYLVNLETYGPLCPVYESNYYTKEMQDLLAMTTDQFDENRIYNLDNDTTNNFGVFTDDVIVEKDNELKDQIITETDTGYKVENASEEVKALQPGDIYAYEDENGLLLFKVTTIQIEGTTAIIGAEDTDAEEVFQYLKIDMTATPDTVEYDEAGLDDHATYLGQVESAESDIEADNLSGTIQTKTEFKYQLDKDMEDVLSGYLVVGLAPKITFYITHSLKYFELGIDYEIGFEGEIKTSGEKVLGLGTPKFKMPGCYAKITIGVGFQGSVAIKLSMKVSGKAGCRVSSDDGITDITTSPKLKSDATIEGSIYFGLLLKVEAQAVSKDVASVDFDGKLGAEAKGKLLLEGTSLNLTHHSCKKCIDGDINAVVKLQEKASVARKKYSYTVADSTTKIKDWYYSFDHSEMGWGVCPYTKYDVKIVTADKSNNVVDGVMIEIEKADYESCFQTTNGEAKAVLSPGTYTIRISKNGYKAKKQELVLKDENRNLKIVLEKGAPRIDKVKLSWNTCAVIDETGALYMSGDGSPSKTPQLTWVMNNVKDVQLGGDNQIILKEDGSAWVRGNNRWGQIGNGTKTDGSSSQYRNDNVNIPYNVLNDVDKVYAGNNMFAVIKKNGELWTWGSNSGGQLGQGKDMGELQENSLPCYILKNINKAALDPDSSNICAAIGKNGELYIWGVDFGSKPQKIMNDVMDINVNGGSCLIRKTDDTIWGMGTNHFGQLGIGSIIDTTIPQKINLNNVDKAGMIGSMAYAITKNKDLYIWGGRGAEVGEYKYNDDGYLYYQKYTDISLTDNLENNLVPTKIMSNVKTVCGNDTKIQILTQDGKLYGMGMIYKYLSNIGDASQMYYSPKYLKEKIVDIVYTNPDGYDVGAPIWGIKTDEGIEVAGATTFIFPKYGDDGCEVKETKNFEKVNLLLKSDIAPAATQELEINTAGDDEIVKYTDLNPNEFYNFYQLRKKDNIQDILDAENLLYVTQSRADENGTLEIVYTKTGEQESGKRILAGESETIDSNSDSPTPTPTPDPSPAPTQNPAPSQNPAPTPSAAPQQPASTSVYQYEKLADGTIRITSCQTKDMNLVIPDTIDGYTVTEIGESAFANQSSIQTIKFPANLKQIGVKAFANCIGLLEVTLPDTIQGAGQLCFSGCTALKKAVLNKGRINIVYGMFENCTSLTEVVIPDTVENVAMYAFLNCRSLTHLNLPASLKSISVHAFEGAGVTTITYAGTKAQWQKVKKNLTGNGSFVTATVTDSTGVSFVVSGSNNGNQNPQQTVKKPGKVKITKAKNVKTKKLTVKWKKTSKAKGYQIQIASNKKFTKGKKTKTLSKTTYSFKKLKKNKYYYVRVRAYVYNSNHKKVYGSWSAVKKVKIKK